jgi:predicted RNase H-like HicB family nuclease
MRKSRDRQFTVLIERDNAGWFVASVPEFPGCHTQARSLDKLMERIREAIALCIEVEHGGPSSSEFIGVQRIAI